MLPPIPCMHCGVNFMRTTTNPEAPRLCNNCLLKENIRNPRKEDNMEETTVQILITCPRQDQIDIEEICINQGIDFSRYFLELHYGSQAAIAEMKRLQALPPVEESAKTIEKVNSLKTSKGGKK